MSDSGKAVFLSYASQDAEAAKRICDALRAAGVEVWFDQSELVGGDAWDQKIRRQIRECALLIPIISAATQARTEGYFRLEWRLADQRTHLMAKGRAFLLPVVIDVTRDADAHVPDSFTEVQWTRLLGGDTPPAFAQRVKKLLGGSDLEPGRPRPGNETRGEVTAPPKKKFRRWLAPVIAGAGIAILALVLSRPWEKAPTPTVPAKSVETAKPAAPATEAQKLVAQARQVYENGDELNRDNLFLAEELVQRALTLDPAEPAAWELATWLSCQMIWHSIEDTQARRETLLRQANRAVALAPDSVAAQLVFANAELVRRFGGTIISQGRADEIEASLQRLALREPQNWRIQRTLGTFYRYSNRMDESTRTLLRAIELSGGHPMATADLVNVLIRRGRYSEAETLLTGALGRQRSGRLLTFNLIVKCRWRGDVQGATKDIAEWPDWLLQQDRGIAVAWQTALWARQPALALRLVQQFPRQYVRDMTFSGPRAVLSARAQELAGNIVAAQADWGAVLQQCDQDLAANAADIAALYWKAWALARLGDQTRAQSAATLLQQRLQSVPGNYIRSYTAAALWATVGWADVAVATLQAELEKTTDYISLTRAGLELEPAFDSIRQDPRFVALLKQAHAPQSTAAIAPKVDDKSVAVLAFANLSDDKGNEYFSDGISEELLNVLVKIPGLKVSARTSAFYFKGKEVPVPEIAKQLGVAYVVEGSVRKAGNQVRITAQLIKAADGFHVWSDTFTRDIKDVFAVQDEIAGLIAKNLELKMGIGEAGARQAVSPEAYQEYLLGRAAFAKASMADLHEAVTHFKRAVALEPKYTAAWVQLASAHTRLGRWGGAATLESWAAARAAIDRARVLEPDSPDVLLALGWIQRTGEWDWKGAEQTFRRALALQPNQPEILAGAAVLLYNIGQTEEAFRLARQAVQLDPLNAGTQVDLSIMFYENNNWVEAEQAARRALQLAPGGTSYHSILAWSLIKQGKYAEAEAEIALDNDVIEQPATLGILAIARGQGAKARAMLARLEELARTRGDTADLQTCTAWLYAGLGDKDRAFAALEKARATRDPSMSWLRNSGELSALFSDPRWNTLLHQVGLADEQLK